MHLCWTVFEYRIRLAAVEDRIWGDHVVEAHESSKAMHRQFASGGTEKDVVRWLKEMGYRGPGLKKESLAPLCRGEMQQAWEALMASCRPASVVKEMKRKVQLKLQRQAALESRQKTQEDAEKRQRQIERIQQLQKQCKERDAEVERLKAEVQARTSELAKLEGRCGAQKEKMQRQVERSKILTAFVSKTEEVTGSVTKEMQCLQKRNATARKALQEKSETGWADFESVMHAMHEVTSNHISEKLRMRALGQILTAEEIMPKIEAQPETKDPAVSRLMCGIGQLYSHHTKHLTEYFVEACRRAQVELAHYEAKYRTTMQLRSEEWESAQMATIEEMQVAHIKSFLALKQSEEQSRQRMSSLKSSNKVQRLLKAVEEAGLYELFNSKLENHCLRSEIEMLEREIEKQESKIKNESSDEREAKEMWSSLKAHVEQSHQTDVLIQDCMRQIRQLEREFGTITAGIASKVKQELPQSIELCLESLQECENGMRNELDAFAKLNLNGRVKTPGLEEAYPSVPSKFPLLQRTDLTTESEPTTYWTASLQEVYFCSSGGH